MAATARSRYSRANRFLNRSAGCPMSADARFRQTAQELGYSFDGEIKIGGNYVPIVRHQNELYISGQIPRIGDTVVVTGRAGADTSLAQAQLAAKICAMR